MVMFTDAHYHLFSQSTVLLAFPAVCISPIQEKTLISL
jgi:hypothetical protein